MIKIMDLPADEQVIRQAARLLVEGFRGHPYGFYLKLGFALVGVIPDANGPGRPDILMAKRVGGKRE